MRALLLSSVVELPRNAFKPKHHIHYNHKDVLQAQSDNLPEDFNVDTLFFSGTHGHFGDISSLNGIAEPDVVRLLDKLRQKNKGTLKNIVLDSCDSAYFVPHFKDLLDNDGIVYCNLSTGRLHTSLEILKDYKIYKNFTLGIAFNNIVSNMAKYDAGIRDEGDVTYPAIYQKNDNTLYYYGPADKELIENLSTKEIRVIEIKNFNAYLDKLKESKTPLKEDLDQLAATNECIADWTELGQPLVKDQSRASADNAVKKKLLNLFAKYFKDKEKMSVEEYTKILFPIAKRTVSEGSNPIKILAMAACQYRLGHEKEADVEEFSNAISQVLQVNFATGLLQKELLNQLNKTPSPTTLQWNAIADHLRNYGKVILGEQCSQPLEPIISELIPKKTEEPTKESTQEPTEKPVVETPIEKKATMKMNWQKAILHAVLVGFASGVCLYFAPIIGISLSLNSIRFAMLAISCMHFWKDIFVHHVKVNNLNHYSKNDISTINEEKLKSFMEGANHTVNSTINSAFSYRAWVYLPDYYAGLAAAQSNRNELIESVQKRLRVLGA